MARWTVEAEFDGERHDVEVLKEILMRMLPSMFDNVDDVRFFMDAENEDPEWFDGESPDFAQ